MPVSAKPKHRLLVKFEIAERPIHPVNQEGPAWGPPDQPITFVFDSASAHVFEKPEYFEGHAPEQATGRCFYSHLIPQGTWSDPRNSLRLLWWEIEYKNGQERIAGAVLNEAMEAALGRLKGKITVTAPGFGETVIDGATLSDQSGCRFWLGAPVQEWVNWPKLQYYVANSPKDTFAAPKLFSAPIPCQDAIGGKVWNSQWTPQDRTDDPRYQGDSRNPGITVQLNGIKVPRIYERQTHAHYRECFRSSFETMYIAAAKLQDQELEGSVLRALNEWVDAQVGAVSPVTVGAYIDGRPNHLALFDGTPFRAGVKYNLNDIDRAAPRTCELSEGRPAVSKGKWQFTECFGRKGLHFLELAGHYMDQYRTPNGSDFEHGGQENLAAAAIILGDPTAKRQLHHICEEHMSKPVAKFHSTRSDAGWKLVDLWLGYLVFQGNSVFGNDAERYRQRAYEIAQAIWEARLDQTPYQALLTVGYEYIPKGVPENEIRLNEASMQLGIATYAACLGARLESDSVRREFWLDLVRYNVGCLLQPGVVDWSRGGILARYSTGGPAALNPDDPKSVGQRLEETAPSAYRFRNVLSAEGWVGQGLSMASRLILDWPELTEMSRQVYVAQKMQRVEGGAWFLSPQSWSAWTSARESVVTHGWYSPDTSTMVAPPAESNPDDVAQWPSTVPVNVWRSLDERDQGRAKDILGVK